MELTVEDPSEDFAVFRLANDYREFAKNEPRLERSQLKYSDVQIIALTNIFIVLF